MIATKRLTLRRWRRDDLEPFAALNADPAVMAHFPAVMSRAESDATVERYEAGHVRSGFGRWAVERIEDGVFLGCVGLVPVPDTVPCAPAVDLGYRFARHAWGAGYAAEASRGALAFGFDKIGLVEIVAFTAVPNHRSQAVMRRIGMVRDPARDFDHPALPEGHRLRRHVLWAAKAPGGGA